MTTSAFEPTQATTMRRYLEILNEISELGVQGFAAVIDTANETELMQLLSAAEIVQQQIVRWKASPR